MLDHLNKTAQAPTRVVVMGAGGFVGGALTARLKRDGIAVLALTRKDVDLLSPTAATALRELLRPRDAFVAVSALAPCKNSEMLVQNMVMAKAMVQGLSSASVAHVVNISSDAVYADGPLPLTEFSPTAPTSIHGVMHLARELVFRAEVPAPLAMVRPTLLYGANDPHNGYGPNRFRRLVAAGKEVVLFGAGEERRDHVFIDDVAELVLRILLHRSVGALNVATGHVHSFRQIAEMVVKLFGTAPEIKGSPRTGPMPHDGYRPFDIAACTTAFPDFRYTPLERGLALAHGK
jgi:UDP-glucose 4-epimerase